MAMHRKLSDVTTPAELIEFAPKEWATTEDAGDWRPGWRRWRAARRSWAASHPGSLGDWIDRQSAELAVHRNLSKRS